MPLFALPNLVSNETSPCAPWEFSCNVPENVRGKEGKEHRRRWITQSTTVHQVYSGFEGLNPNQRISDSRGVDEGNPPLKCHCLIADVDLPISEEELQAGIKRLGTYVPNYIERTLSGNVRLLWLLEKPVAFPNFRFAKEWLKLALERTRLDSVSAGFDKPAWEDPNRYYTNSGVWCCYAPDVRIPFAVANGWIVETAEKHVWKKDKGAIEIPLPEVFREIEKKWPGAWQGDFVEEASGPSFWLPGSESAKSAKVKTTGIFTWSAHAVKPFYSWADLLGAQFVDEYKARTMGKAVEGIYHDGTSYWRTNGYGSWKTFSKEDICSHLRVDRGISSQKNGDVPSDVDRAVQHIQNWQGIDGAAPLVFQPSGIVKRNGKLFLNTHTRKVLQPAAAGGDWPWLRRYFAGLFDPSIQLDYFYSWLSRFYVGAYNYDLEGGQNIFVMGSVGVGKTFLSQGILPKLFSGSEDAEDFLLGLTQFNAQLFEVAVLTVDDQSSTVDAATHRKFSAMVKKLAANQQFSYHAKFRTPCEIRWLGRVIITANDDEESARILPDLSISILDKLMLFRTTKVPHVEFPDQKALEKILADELPHFARFLLDYKIPEHCKGTSRFGVKAYHEPSLITTADQSSRTAGFGEILSDWADSYFAETKELTWSGTSYQFLKALHQSDLAVSASIKNLSADMVSRNLMGMKAKGFNIEASSEKNQRVWTIHKPSSK